MGKAGVNISSIRGYKPDEVLSIVEKLANIGYQGIEFVGCNFVPPGELRKVLDCNGIVSCGGHVAYESLVGEPDAVLDYHLEIGSPYLVCPGLPEGMRNEEGVQQAAEALYKTGKKCKQSGIHLMYQHHDWELKEHDGRNALDIMVKMLPQDFFSLQMETFWLYACMDDPVRFFAKYKNHCKSIHIGDKKNRETLEYTELGRGIADIESIVKTCEEFNVEWYVVQQEHYGQNMFISLEENCGYLKRLLKR
jgi:sugar phosphate isomerase/epimerase